MKTAQEWFDQANTLYESAKFEEANKCLDEALALDNKFMQAYRWKFKLFYSLGKYQDMIYWCDKALEVDPKYFFAYNSKGNALKMLGRLALALDKAISIDPQQDVAYNGKANTLNDMGRHEEAIECYDKSIALNPDNQFAYNGKGLSLTDLGRLDEALKTYDKGIEVNPKDYLCLCNRGKLLSKMGKQQEAIADFKRIQALHQSGFVVLTNTPQNLRFIEGTLKSIVELDEMSAATEATIKNADQNNPTVKKLLKNVKLLQENKNKITANLISNIDKNDAAETSNLMQELQNLKREFAEMQKEITTIKEDIKNLDQQMKDVREELDSKLDDFHKKLDKDLKKTDLSPEDQQKLKDYFKAFIGTFSSLYVTAQVINSGQVQISADTTQATILSTIASFTPFIGGVLSSGITSVAEFLATKEMLTNARKMNGLASDSSELSQLIGKTAYQAVLNKEKQQQILKVTIEDLKVASAGLFQKLTQFCEDMGQELDVYLYSRLYKSPSSRLGHQDANSLVAEWLGGNIDVYDAEAEFIQKVIALKLEDKPEEKQQVQQRPVVEVERETNRAKDCCNMF